MFKKIFRAISIISLSIFISSTSLFFDVLPVDSAQMDMDSNENISMGIVIEESSDALDGSKINAAPDLGDDQTFPFIPGFGKNSGKD